ncbi:pseudouridine synthase, partial [Viridothelium virens]
MDDDEHPPKRARLSAPEGYDESLQRTAQVNSDEREKEARVGIDRFVVTDAPGFTGIFKQRYTDFLVNEILPNGQVVHLRKVELPAGKDVEEVNGQTAPVESMKHIQKRRLKESNEEQAAARSDISPDVNTQDTASVESKEGEFALNTEDSELLKSIFGQEIVDALLALHKKVLKHPHWKSRDFTPVNSSPMTDRLQRTEAHQALRRIFESRLESKTDNTNGCIKIIAASKPNPRSNARSAPTHTADGKALQVQGRGKVAWDQLGGEYLHFSLAKENKDTMETVNFIALQLKLNPKYFNFAGTKDRRGVTVQRVSGHRVHRDALAALNKRLYSARVGDFEYQASGLDLGDLGGNEFTIVLRDCRLSAGENPDVERRMAGLEEIVGRRVKEFEVKGWINYYGLQRFGTFTHGTGTIGLKILQGNFEGAVDLLLDYNSANLDHDNSALRGLISSDDLQRTEALHIWATQRDSRRALEKLPRRFSAESSIIKHLGFRDKKTGQTNRTRDFQGALSQIPRNLRLMYTHAYQSFVWNAVAGKRLELFGLNAVAGDLVIVGEKEKEQRKSKPNGEAEDDMEVDDAGEIIIKPTAEDSAGNTSENFTRARPLSQTEVESGNYDIFDVVLPLPGFDVEYPSNAIGAFYKDFMGSERGGGLDPYNMRRSWKDTSLSGDYRKLMARPLEGVKWEVRRYSDPEEQLVETDLDKHIDRPEKVERVSSGMDEDDFG